jgi:STE24 endopeptidase
MGFHKNWRRCWRIGALTLLLALSFAAVGFAQPASSAQVEAEPAGQTAGTHSADAYRLPPAKLAQAIALSRARLFLHFGEEFWQFALLLLLLACGAIRRLSEWTTARTQRRWPQGAIYAAALTILIFLAADMPAAAVGHALSLHYGISVEDWRSWLLDEIKLLGLTLLLEIPLLMLVLWLTHWSPRRYWLWFASAAVPIMLLGTFLLPPLIEPLFNDYEPLAKSHPALVQQLERVVARTGTSIPQERMFLMKASEKSNGLNAYVSGLGASKRIVVWDTTADRMPADEILFTFAHETGHYVLNHIAKGLTLAAIGMFALFWLVAKFAESLVRRFGRLWRVSAIASLPGLAVLLLALSVLQIVTEPIDSTISRHFEHEADVYGQEAIHGLVPDPQRTAVASFNRLGEAYLDDPNPNPFLEFWSYDHPSTQHRATFAAHYDPWKPGQAPQFFAK